MTLRREHTCTDRETIVTLSEQLCVFVLQFCAVFRVPVGTLGSACTACPLTADWIIFLSLRGLCFSRSQCVKRVCFLLSLCLCARTHLAEEAVKLWKWLPASLGSIRQQICRSLLCQGRAETVVLLFNRKQFKVPGAGSVLFVLRDVCPIASVCVRLDFLFLDFSVNVEWHS